MAEVKQDVSEHTKRIEVTENRVTVAEKDLEKLQVELTSTVKRLTYLEMKTDDLENRSRRKKLACVWSPVTKVPWVSNSCLILFGKCN